MRTSLTLVALALAASTLAGCSSEAEMRAVDPAAGSDSPAADSPAADSPAPASMPSAVPAADGEVRTRNLATVLDQGEAPQLCLGAVAESYPPQCSGLLLAGWDWSEHPEHEEAAGTRWGLFMVTGTFDGTTFTATDAISAALYDPMAEEPEPPLGTPCEDPQPGDGQTSSEAMDATLNAAPALPGYAMAWLDGNTVNVAVTEDPAGAEATLRETWGGPLCVSSAEHTQRELEAIQMELNKLPGLLAAGSTRPDHLGVEVVHDDGSIQAWVDQEYGEGLVTVTSALVPAE